MIGMDKDRSIYNKLFKLCKENKNPVCPYCKVLLQLNEAMELHYIKTKRGTEIFIHNDCIKKWLS